MTLETSVYLTIREILPDILKKSSIFTAFDTKERCIHRSWIRVNYSVLTYRGLTKKIYSHPITCYSQRGQKQLEE